VSLLPRDRPPRAREDKALAKEARAALRALEARLARGGLPRPADLDALARILAEERLPARERRRAAENALGWEVNLLRRAAAHLRDAGEAARG
jgi:hypothetical protein